MKRSSILTMAVIIIVVVASFGLYGLLNSSHKDFLGAPLPIIVRNTPHAYMEVNFTNLSGFTDGYSISFSALTKNISVSSIELNTINGTYSGFVRFNNVSSVYTLNMSPSSIFNVTINGGNVFSDSTSIAIKYISGKFQSFTSIEILDIHNDIVISQALLSQNLSQNSSLTPSASMVISETSSGGTPQCYALSFSGVKNDISLIGLELEIFNGTLNGSIHFSANFSQYAMNMSKYSSFAINVYGGNVFSDSTYITIKLKCGTSQTLSSVKLIDFDTAGTIVSGSLFSN